MFQERISLRDAEAREYTFAINGERQYVCDMPEGIACIERIGEGAGAGWQYQVTAKGNLLQHGYVSGRRQTLEEAMSEAILWLTRYRDR